MRAGRAAALCLAGLLAVVIAGAWLLLDAKPVAHELIHHGTPPIRAAVLIGGVFALFVLILTPIGLLFDRAMQQLQEHIEGAAHDTADAPFTSHRWLGPISHAFAGAVDQFRQREQALRNQHRELEIRHRVSEAERRQIEAVLHSLRDGVVVVDAFNEVAMANDEAAAVLGFNLRESIHRPLREIVDDPFLGQVVTDTHETANFNDPRRVEHRMTVTRPNGEREERMYEITLSCVENHKQEVGGVVAVLHDLTHEYEVAQMKSDFVSKASHELRTPLSSIRAYVEMLVDGEATDEQSRREFYQIIQSETDRLGRLIDNMLNISRLEAGIIQIDRTIVDLGPLIDRVITSIDPQAREKNISLHKKAAPVDLCVEGDADMLYQAVLNLVSNAVKYTPDGGRVSIAADTDNLTRSVLVSVSDTGLGIPPDAIPRLFDKFFRVENYKRVAKGTGLGLSLCKHIIETVHRGQIGVESKLGMGSKFWFSIPMRYIGSQAA